MAALVRKIELVFDRVLNFLTVLAGVLLAFMLCSVNLDVVMRYALHRPILGLMEVTEVLQLYVTFLASAWVLRKEGHVKVDVVLNLFNTRTQYLINMVTSSMGGIVCLVLAWFSLKVTWEHFSKDMYITGAVNIPSGPFLAIIPLGCLLLFMQFLRKANGHFGGWRAHPRNEKN